PMMRGSTPHVACRRPKEKPLWRRYTLEVAMLYGKPYRAGRNGEPGMLQRMCLAVAVTAAILVTWSESFAQFRVCNRSSADSIEVAFGLQRGWDAEGWFTVKRRQCETLVARTLRERYFYLYAVAGDSVWDGEDDKEGAEFCTQPDGAFKLNDASLRDGPDKVDCEKHGYETRKFFQVDIKEAPNYTFNFED